MATKNVIEILINATDQASKKFETISKNSQKLSDSLKDIRKYSGIATTALVWLWTVMVKQATDVEPVKNAFENLTKTVWESSDTMLKSLKSASKWAVSEYNLMLSANRALKLWVAKNTDDMSDLMKIARLYGQQMGQDVTQSFNDIVTWLGRWSPMILDNLWIIIDSEKAYEEYAQKLWKTSKELTKAEKTQALVNATLTEWRKALEEFWEPAQTMAERFAQLKNSFADTATKIWEALLPVVQKLLETIQPIINKVADWIQANPELASKILLVTTAIAGLIFVITSLTSIIPTIVSAIWVLSGPIGLVIWAITALWVAYATNFWGFRDFVNETWQLIQPVLVELKDAFVECFWEIWESIKEVYKQLEPILIPIWEFFKETVKRTLLFVVELVKSSFKAIWDYVKWVTLVFNEVIDFFRNIFSWNWKWALENLNNITAVWLDTIINIFADFWIDLPAIFETLKTTITKIWDGLFSWLKNICSSAVDRISSKVQKVWDKINAAKDAIASLRWWGSSWWRASWGKVIAWQTYRVNEIHWEYFTPAVNWIVTPAPVMNSSPNISINFWDVNIRDEQDVRNLIDEMKEGLMDVYRNIALWYS